MGADVRIGEGLRRHPWNVDFTWTDHGGPFRTISEEQAARFDEHGYVVIDDAFDAATITVVRDELDERERRVEERLRGAEGQRFSIAEAGAITFTVHPALGSATLARFATHPLLAGVCADLVGPDVDLYWDQAVYKKPEKPRRFPWHQDNGYAFVRPQQYLTCWVALTDATLENGCPQVAPGVHRLGTLTHTYVDPLGWECFDEPPVPAVAAPVRAGQMVVFSSLTPHLTGPNTTDDVRKAYILQYCPTGAEVLRGDAATGAPTSVEPCDDPDRYLPVVRDGRPAARRRG